VAYENESDQARRAVSVDGTSTFRQWLRRVKIPRTLGADRYSGIYLWIAFIVTFGIWSPHVFFTSATLHSVASAQAISGIIALAVLIPLVCSEFDVSVGPNANLAGIVAILVQVDWNWSVPLAIIFALAVATVIGLVNAFLVVHVRIPSFIATLATGSVIGAAQVWATSNQQPAPPNSSTWGELTQTQFLGFQVVIFYLIALALIIWWILDHTPAGRYFRAVGASRDAARLAGLKPEKWSFISLVASGFLAGVGGVLYTSLVGPSLDFGSALLLPSFAAAFLGSTQLKPGRFNVWGTLIAIYMLATGAQGLEIVSQQVWIGDLFNGFALIVAVGFSVRSRRMTMNGPSVH
jgi:ribose transport system permease protein